MRWSLGAALLNNNRRILQALLSSVTQPCCCCSTQAAAPTLKTVLRQLYKKVHPDLFHGDQTARLANEHSFKLLQVCCTAINPHQCFSTYFVYINTRDIVA